jgi:uncharacterized protein YegL
MRRLPVYFLLDTSGSMNGEPIQALNNALSGMIHSLRSDAQASETLWISIITFDKEVKEVAPLTEMPAFQLQEINCPQIGPTNTGKALELLYEKTNKEFRKGTLTQKGDFRPLLFIFTDGKPSDPLLYSEMTPKIKSLNFATIVGCAAGSSADSFNLKLLCDKVIKVDYVNNESTIQFFQWCADFILLNKKDDDNDTLDNGDILNPKKPILPKMGGLLNIMN